MAAAGHSPIGALVDARPRGLALGPALMVAMSDDVGLMAESYAYSPFGESDEGAGLVGNPYRFTGRRLDPETGLYDYRARHYDPVLGRFLQPDPAGYVDGLNLYAYARNDPLNLIDPSGLATFILAASIVGGAPTGAAAIAEGGLLFNALNSEVSTFATTGLGGGVGAGAEFISFGFFNGSPERLEGFGIQSSFTVGPVTISVFESASGDTGFTLGTGLGESVFVGPTFTNVTPLGTLPANDSFSQTDILF